MEMTINEAKKLRDEAAEAIRMKINCEMKKLSDSGIRVSALELIELDRYTLGNKRDYFLNAVNISVAL
jgi:hypothetical protein